MSKASKWSWVVAAIVIIGLITWYGTQETSAPQPMTASRVERSVTLLTPPLRASVGVPVSLIWSVNDKVGAVTTHTAIHWGQASHPGVLGAEVVPANSGYQNVMADYVAGSFALPREFTGSIIFSAAGAYYYRAHALIDGAHVWSPEYIISAE